MYEILRREALVPNIHLFKMAAPEVAKKARPGQFVVIRIDEKGERIPLTVADWDEKEGSVTVVCMEVGTTTRRLATLGTGEAIADFAGPLGVPTHIEKLGTVVCVAGGFAVAVVMPIARAMRQMGNNVISILGARNKDLIFWEEELRRVSDELIVTTDDGSYARKGMVTEPLKELLEGNGKVDRVIAIGPSIMMKFCAKTTEPFGVRTIVSLNPIMVDGTGMCGCCRVSVGGVTKFACVDGPDFDGHQVDWDLLFARQRTYLDEEKWSLEQWQCQGGGHS
ncbi:MAG: sulfide/dihydroorotate dehydrogenase-like FAD/NAD-binding protein [Dehalococcoidales bacterium]|jgi:ferredoxin--NADP+ reductase|nr:sulfide/dihydroorotate dehydrogenase-like FAD/NAD-binding protein [Dehalococcoidales bacterium]MDP7286253.1 sulfide/dihydroorotate dehydrogenase-like FAD/NAD-binding protein [Dehalococcoidales bacterium]MDP7415727.1 sulfide/dihydroorotate dehydrogenase-like FAD/NAD-binding protein [Dehalococcoidales bacterium]